MTTPALSLEGIRVLDLSRVLAGPFCGMLLSDLGADVIKIEDTSSGDESRTWPPHKDGESAAFLVINRNKRDMTLDLKAPEGVAILKRMVASADVLVENFRTGTMESFGLGYDELAAINPRLVYCSVSAFGRTGPRKDGAGYEALMQAFSGIMSITGEPGGPPVRAGVSFLDLTTGIFCAFGIVNALLHRVSTGLGQRVDASLLETAVTLLNYHAEGYLLTGAQPKALGSSHPSLSPYRTFKCRDGQWVFIAGANDRFWQRLAPALGLGHMASDPRFAVNIERVKNRRDLEEALETAIAKHDREPLLKVLEEAGVPATPVNTVAQVMEDPQTAARGMIQRVVHPRLGEIPVVGTPVKFSRMKAGVRTPAPQQGEHTDQVLAEFGYSPSDIAALRAKKVVV
ncbi:MAG TPA: CaiB/BaiF CoA-transferase family protein [Patescibacteria group bacterium]|jgi:crotonobetainyl-CoA:carnitine CoA-transferase CaiB-like acyl-CoA transferase|nr:CaiB/BaiF CoA-transferase family protein [Patescibacteria group bacterium]